MTKPSARRPPLHRPAGRKRAGPPPRLFATAVLLAACLAGPALAETKAEPPAPSPEAVQQLVIVGGLLCTEAPARDCIDLGWRFADANRDGVLDLAELRALRRGVLDWAAEAQAHLGTRDRMALGAGRALMAAVPLGTLFDLYDADGDGRLTRVELLADLRLDERPLAAILMDREATDWTAIRARLGQAGALLGLLGAPE